MIIARFDKVELTLKLYEGGTRDLLRENVRTVYDHHLDIIGDIAKAIDGRVGEAVDWSKEKNRGYQYVNKPPAIGSAL